MDVKITPRGEVVIQMSAGEVCDVRDDLSRLVEHFQGLSSATDGLHTYLCIAVTKAPHPA